MLSCSWVVFRDTWASPIHKERHKRISTSSKWNIRQVTVFYVTFYNDILSLVYLNVLGDMSGEYTTILKI